VRPPLCRYLNSAPRPSCAVIRQSRKGAWRKIDIGWMKELPGSCSAHINFRFDIWLVLAVPVKKRGKGPGRPWLARRLSGRPAETNRVDVSPAAKFATALSLFWIRKLPGPACGAQGRPQKICSADNQ